LKRGNIMKKINQIERLNYSGGLLGMIFGSTKGKMQHKVSEMNNQGWNLHLINNDQPNLILWIIRFLILGLTIGLWTIGSSEILIFEKEE
jgi:hypothetical protein